MSATKAQLKAKDKYEQKAYFKTLIRIKKNREEEIRKYAGDSLNGFIVEAIEEKIARMKLDEEKE